MWMSKLKAAAIMLGIAPALSAAGFLAARQASAERRAAPQAESPKSGAGDSADWPQWRGPDRTGCSSETGLLKSWSEGGPPLVWKARNAGEGYSTPSVTGGRLYTMGDRGPNEYVICYDIRDGRELWAFRNGKSWRDPYGYHGPRCTPTIDGDRLYALGGNGNLCCLNSASGRMLWRLNILKVFKGQAIKWGMSESLLVEGTGLIVTPGGDDGTIVALHKLTGKTIWTSKDPAAKEREPAGYASPIAFTVGGVRQIATLTSKGGIGVRAKDGKFLWRYNRVANKTANCTTPIFHEDQIFFTSSYNTGCAVLRLKPEGPAEEVFFSRRLQNHHGGVVLLDGYLYGSSGFKGGPLVCMKFATGEVMWRDRSVGQGSISYADGRLYYRSETSGEVALVEPTPAGYREKGRFLPPDRSKRPAWAHPVIAGGRLYLHDQDVILCYDVKEK